MIGLFTNFYLETDTEILWTPTPSRVLSDGNWIKEDSGYRTLPRRIRITVHADGGNVLSQEGVNRVFTAIDVARDTLHYDEVCEDAKVSMEDEDGETTCLIYSVSNFWNDNINVYNQSVTSDEDAIQTLSRRVFPDGTPVVVLSILGNPTWSSDDNVLTSAQIFSTIIFTPPTDESFILEGRVITNILDLRKQWDEEPGNIFRLEISTLRCFSDEVERAIVKDIPLVPMIFVVMSIFTCVIFCRRHWIYSRCFLGFGAVFTVLLSIMTSYGLLFLIGVPFTSMTQILPFIIFGVGLDDAFILWGGFQRTDPRKDSAARINDTLQDVGVSIFVTTLTSVVAFSLGYISSVPIVYFLCQYAAAAIAIDFIFQITFFIALIVLDERRVEKRNRDCFVCFGAPTYPFEKNLAEDGNYFNEEKSTDSVFGRFMIWLSTVLTKPAVKAVVVILSFLLFGFSIYSSTKLRQELNIADVLPESSYYRNFWETYTDYTSSTAISPYIIFRDVDQSDPSIQRQMEEFVNDIVDIKSVTQEPQYFWLRDYKSFLNSTDTDDTVKTLSFNQQLDIFLSIPPNKKLYKDDIVRDESGNILTSRTVVKMDNIDYLDIKDQIDALGDQRVLSESQDKGRDDWAFFTFEIRYYLFQFYTSCPSELKLTTIIGVSAISFISLIFIPHWTSILFVAPVICMLYIDLLGFLQVCGVAINAVSFISLVMSIGLLVDFLMHILLRYYESKELSRAEKVKDAIQTMGTSVLIGAISTFLGIIPLVMSTSEVFWTIFITFVGVVVFGATHGLIFLSVVLSFVGPEVTLELNPDKEREENKM